MKNIKDLREELIDLFDLLKEGKIKTRDAKEIINCSGKIILSAKTELDYNKYVGKKQVIGFLEVDEDKVVENKVETIIAPVKRGRKPNVKK